VLPDSKDEGDRASPSDIGVAPPSPNAPSEIEEKQADKPSAIKAQAEEPVIFAEPASPVASVDPSGQDPQPVKANDAGDTPIARPSEETQDDGSGAYGQATDKDLTISGEADPLASEKVDVDNEGEEAATSIFPRSSATQADDALGKIEPDSEIPETETEPTTTPSIVEHPAPDPPSSESEKLHEPAPTPQLIATLPSLTASPALGEYTIAPAGFDTPLSIPPAIPPSIPPSDIDEDESRETKEVMVDEVEETDVEKPSSPAPNEDELAIETPKIDNPKDLPADAQFVSQAPAKFLHDADPSENGVIEPSSEGGEMVGKVHGDTVSAPMETEEAGQREKEGDSLAGQVENHISGRH
jgi:hypothetical protein